MRLLAVDDDPVIHDLLADGLAPVPGLELTCTLSARGALEMLDAGTPVDAFLLDIMMPEMDGITLCALLRDRPEHRATPILMLTSAAARRNMPSAFAAGATDFLAKPIDATELAARLNMAMMLHDSLSEARRAREQLKRFLSELGEEARPGPAVIPEFAPGCRLLPPLALENRLLHLRNGAYTLTIITFRIPGFSRVWETTTASGFRTAIETTAEAIFDVLPETGTTLSYIGHGAFIGVVEGPNRLVPQLLAARIGVSIALRTEVFGGLDLPTPSVQVAAPTTRRVWTAPDAVYAVQGASRALLARCAAMLPDPESELGRLLAHRP